MSEQYRSNLVYKSVPFIRFPVNPWRNFNARWIPIPSGCRTEKESRIPASVSSRCACITIEKWGPAMVHCDRSESASWIFCSTDSLVKSEKRTSRIWTGGRFCIEVFNRSIDFLRGNHYSELRHFHEARRLYRRSTDHTHPEKFRSSETESKTGEPVIVWKEKSGDEIIAAAIFLILR